MKVLSWKWNDFMHNPSATLKMPSNIGQIVLGPLKYKLLTCLQKKQVRKIVKQGKVGKGKIVFC